MDEKGKSTRQLVCAITAPPVPEREVVRKVVLQRLRSGVGWKKFASPEKKGTPIYGRSDHPMIPTIRVRQCTDRVLVFWARVVIPLPLSRRGKVTGSPCLHTERGIDTTHTHLSLPPRTSTGTDARTTPDHGGPRRTATDHDRRDRDDLVREEKGGGCGRGGGGAAVSALAWASSLIANKPKQTSLHLVVISVINYRSSMRAASSR
jgi:hypothetical protein